MMSLRIRSVSDLPVCALALCAGALVAAAASGCAHAPRERFDVLITGGTVYDGSGAPGVRADVGVVGDTIKVVGDLHGGDALVTVRADGLAVAPGFVNMMSQDDSLRVDGRS